MRLGVAEILQRVEAAKTKEEKIAVFHKHAPGDTTLFEVLRMAFEKSYPKWHSDIPTKVEHRKNPYFDQQPALQQGMRHLKRVFFEDTPLAMPAEKRALLYVQFLESLDNDDCAMLEGIRGGQLPYKSVTRKLVVETFPGLLNEEVQVQE